MMRSTASQAVLAFARSFTKKAKKTEPSPGIKALYEIDGLMEKGSYQEAYNKLEEAD